MIVRNRAAEHQAGLILAVLALISLTPRAWALPIPLAQQRPGVIEQWAEVITVTNKWLVLQNGEGQQFPVSLDAIGLFLIRWPTTLDRITPASLLEATGIDRGSYAMMTDHVDVYEGAARSLVTPGLIFFQGSGRTYRPIDFTFNSEAYGEPFPGLGAPIQGGVNLEPARIHIVGPVQSRIPFRIHVIEGNNAITIVPPPQGVSLTQITPGNAAYVRPGDRVYFAAFEARPKSLILEQLVVYKSMPLDQFGP